jgi:hypothetical protein
MAARRRVVRFVAGPLVTLAAIGAVAGLLLATISVRACVCRFCGYL